MFRDMFMGILGGIFGGECVAFNALWTMSKIIQLYVVKSSLEVTQHILNDVVKLILKLSCLNYFNDLY